jgi:hypothetical protein
MNARELSTRLVALLRTEHAALGDFLLALAEFDRRKAWRELGHASLFAYLRRELGLSAGAAQYRKTAAELIQRFPEVEAALREGRLCLSTVVEVAKVLTAENRAEVLPRFFGLSRREAEALAVAIRPVEDPARRDVVTAVVPPRAALALSAALPDLLGRSPADAERRTPSILAASTRDGLVGEARGRGTMGGVPVAPLRPAEPAATATPITRPIAAAPSAPAREEVTKPLDAERARLHVTVSRRFLEKLEAAKDALSHARPGASAEEILEAGLDLLLRERARRNGLVANPRETPRPSRTDAVPAHVRRAVFGRAGGRCEWRLDSGEVCGCTTRVELDHVVPRARGGPSTIENLRVLCRPHNLLAARRAFGDAVMIGTRGIRRARRRSGHERLDDTHVVPSAFRTEKWRALPCGGPGWTIGAFVAPLLYPEGPAFSAPGHRCRDGSTGWEPAPKVPRHHGAPGARRKDSARTRASPGGACAGAP